MVGGIATMNQALISGEIDFHLTGGTYSVSPARANGFPNLRGSPEDQRDRGRRDRTGRRPSERHPRGCGRRPILLLSGLTKANPHARELRGDFDPANTVWVSFVRSLVLAGLTVAILAIVAYPIAYGLARIFGRRASLVSLRFDFPLFVSENVRLYGWVLFFIKSGVLDGTLRAMGLPGGPDLLFTPPRPFSAWSTSRSSPSGGGGDEGAWRPVDHRHHPRHRDRLHLRPELAARLGPRGAAHARRRPADLRWHRPARPRPHPREA